MTAPWLVLTVILTIGLLAAPLAAEAQPAGRVYRIGYLSLGGISPEVAHLPVPALSQRHGIRQGPPPGRVIEAGCWAGGGCVACLISSGRAFRRGSVHIPVKIDVA